MADEGEHHEGKRPRQLSRNLAQAPAVWKTERGSCHMAYPPGLLPASAWKKQMDDLKNHYGVNATLTAEDEKIIRSYLSTAAASNGPTTATARVSHRASPPPAGLCASMMKSAPACGSEAVGSAANCQACHSGAAKGDFNEDAVRIPR
jgi:hypothetical protein